jgi:hypothetical protein
MGTSDKHSSRPSDEETDPIQASVEDVAAVAENLIERLDMYPERYRVADFPNDKQLGALKSIV